MEGEGKELFKAAAAAFRFDRVPKFTSTSIMNTKTCADKELKHNAEIIYRSYW